MQLSLPQLCSVHGLNVIEQTNAVLLTNYSMVFFLSGCSTQACWLSLMLCANMIVSLWVSECFSSTDGLRQSEWLLLLGASNHTHTNQPISLHMCICVCVCITERGTSCQDNGNSQIPHITFCRDKGLHSFQVFTNIAKENSPTANKQWVFLPSSIRFADRRIQQGCQSLHISIWI